MPLGLEENVAGVRSPASYRVSWKFFFYGNQVHANIYGLEYTTLLSFHPDHSCRRAVLPAEYPHENELHNVRVEKEELGAPVALGARDGLHAAAGGGGGGGVGEEDVFEGAELCRWNLVHVFFGTRETVGGGLRERMHSRGKCR